MIYFEMMRKGFIVAGNLSNDDIRDLEIQGYRIVKQEKLKKKASYNKSGVRIG